MLGKLLKYEIKASARTLIPLYIGTLIVALVCSIQIMLSINSSNGNFAMAVGSFEANNTLTGILFLLFFGLCVAITVLTIMTVIQRFNHSSGNPYTVIKQPVNCCHAVVDYRDICHVFVLDDNFIFRCHVRLG